MIASRAIPPGATLGVFGGGQLGRMFALAASEMGYRVAVFAPEADCPAAQVAAAHRRADYSDLDAVRRFAQACEAVTIEFENVPVETVAVAGEEAIVRPGPDVLAIAQDRVRERAFLARHGLPAAAHARVRSEAEARSAIERVGAPAVFKTARFGYDGKGQARIADPGDAAAAWAGLNASEVLCEAWVDFECELSVIVARGVDGGIETFGPVLNHHRDHILDVSVYPAGVAPRVADEAAAIGRAVAEALALQGVVCVEMFLTADGRLLVNELAPRPHNSGHLTIEACSVSQFQQQTRALCGLPLGATEQRRPGAAMANLLGDLWGGGEPQWERALTTPGVSLHLYGKREAHRGRKMGHLTALASSPQQAEASVRDARRRLATTSDPCGNTAASRAGRPV